MKLAFFLRLSEPLLWLLLNVMGRFMQRRRSGGSVPDATEPVGPTAALSMSGPNLQLSWWDIGEGPLDIDYFLEEWDGLGWSPVIDDTLAGVGGTGGPTTILGVASGRYRCLLYVGPVLTATTPDFITP
jgi:hypothetical protein